MYCCELCYEELPEKEQHNLGDTIGWEFVWQSLICPKCQARARLVKIPISNHICGCYANGKKDPRKEK